MTNLTYSGLGTPRLPSSALVLGLAMTIVLTLVQCPRKSALSR